MKRKAELDIMEQLGFVTTELNELKNFNNEMLDLFEEIYSVREDELYNFNKIKTILKKGKRMK